MKRCATGKQRGEEGKLSEPLKEAKSKIENRIEIKTESEYEGEVRGVRKRQICRDSGGREPGSYISLQTKKKKSHFMPIVHQKHHFCHQSPFA